MIGIALLAAFVVAIVLVVTGRSAPSSPYSATAPPSGSKAVARRSPLQEKLDDWVAADLIEADQADAVLAFELQQSPAKPSRVPLAAEAVGYIGSGLVLAAVALLIGNRWETMSTTPRVAALAIPTIVAWVAGWWTGRSDEPALQRLGGVLWFLAVVGVAGLAAEVWVDAIHDGDPPSHHAALFIGSFALVAAAPAWWIRRRELQQLALFGATIATSLGVLDTLAAGRDRNISPLAAGLVLGAIGTTWVAVSLARRLPPAVLANLSGSALILVGAQLVRADNDHAGLWLGLLASVALMATGVTRSELEIMFVGTAGLFQWTPQIALFYLEDTLGAEATLFVIGTLLIVLAGALTRMYPWVKARHENRTSKPSETSPEADGSGTSVEDRRAAVIVAAFVAILVLVALASQLFGSTTSDRDEPVDDARGPIADDRGPVVDEEWTIALNEQTGGVYTLVMIRTLSPLDEADIEELGGRLVWEETDVELCGISIRAVGDGFVQVGDIFSTAEGCDGSFELQARVDELGPPETACVFVRVGGVDDEYCAPLTVGIAETEG